MPDNIYDYILNEETSFKTSKVPIVDGYEWSFFEHIKRSTMFKNSQYEKSKFGDLPYRNIIRPILNVQYRSEGFNVTDIEPYVNSTKDFYKSFLVRKYHDDWAYKYSMDTFIDEVVESYVDYGGALAKNVNNNRPELVPLQRIAFVDQTDILSGAICEKHMYSPDQLQEMAGKWNADKISEAITMAKAEKTVDQAQGQKAKTPGKYIEVYECHGMFPETWVDTDGDEDKYSRQLHIVCYYKDSDNKKHGISLYKGKEKKTPYKLIIRDAIYGRALGFGGIEELFEAQVWTNYSIIQMKEMLDVASLVIAQTADTAFDGKNKSLADLKKGQILVHEENKPITQINLQPINYEKFNANIQSWEILARTTGSANDAQLGVDPVSGTPLGTTQIVTAQGQGIHKFRQGRIATFMGEIYRDWVIPQLVKDMSKGHEWVDDLSLDEMMYVADSMANCYAERAIIKGLTQGKNTSQEQIDAFKKKFVEEFKKSGNKKFMKIFEDEMKDANIDVKVNIAGKQKDLSRLSDKLTNIFRTIIGNPAILQNPAFGKLFNELLESAGLSPGDFSGFTMPPATPTAPVTPETPEMPMNPMMGGAKPIIPPTTPTA